MSVSLSVVISQSTIRIGDFYRFIFYRDFMHSVRALIVTSMLLINAMPAAAQEIAPAVQAAQTWLQLVDIGDAQASYRLASASFREMVTEVTWRKTLQTIRFPYGHPHNRRLLAATATEQIPGSPVGSYVVIQFGAAFDNKPGQTVETVTPVKESDGSWHVSGYFIQ